MEVKILGSTSKAFDLTYPLNDQTIFWPGGEGFSLCIQCSLDQATQEFYAAGTIKCAEHGGTHVDAPYHFSQHGITVDQITLNNLIAYCHVIDITKKCINSDYQLQPEDILLHESKYGNIGAGNIVLIHTGWYIKYRQGTKAYLGYDESVDGPYNLFTSKLSFPGIGVEAAQLLLQRQIAAVGLDTASLDPGSSKTFSAHRIILSAGVYGIENINENISLLPPTGFTLMVMPLKLTGGTGSPARIIALVQ